MPINRLVALSRQDQVFDLIRGEIVSGFRQVGGRIEPIRDLAKRFGVSPYTVQRAMDRLEAHGHIMKKHGSGTFVTAAESELTLRDTVVLCMDTRGDVFGDLCAMLQRELQTEAHLPVVIDENHPQLERMFRRAALSDAECFIVHGNRYFPFPLLEMKPLAGKTLISVLNWEPDRPLDGVNPVLVNHREGGSLVARRLRERGHRRVLMAGNENMLHMVEHSNATSCAHGQAFRDLWHGVGGTVETMVVRDAPAPELPEETRRVLDLFARPDAPTAVFALMDTQARRLQNLFLAHARDALGRVEIIGYGDTPWSQTAQPPLSSVNWNLEGIVTAVCGVIRSLRGASGVGPGRGKRPGQTIPTSPGGGTSRCVWVSPRLVVRG